jgi:hypothetical protein
MVEVIEYSTENGCVNRQHRDIEVPLVVIPSDVISHLEEIARQAVRKFDTEAERLRKKLKQRIDRDWFECTIKQTQPFTEISLDDEQTYKRFKGGKPIEAVDPCVAIPEFHISLRGRKTGNSYQILDVYLIDSETVHNFGRGSFGLKNCGYDKEKPVPELIRGHFHPPLAGKKESIRNLLSFGDLCLYSPARYANIDIDGMEFLLSMESDEEVTNKIFLRLTDTTVADVPYQIGSPADIRGYDAEVNILENSHERLGYPFFSYSSIVQFKKKGEVRK